MQPLLPKRIGKKTQRKDIIGNNMIYTVVDEVVFIAPSDTNKAYALQKLQFDNNQIKYRICYYMIAQKHRMKGKWAFGQFAPIMTQEDINLIEEKLHKKGWIK